MDYATFRRVAVACNFAAAFNDNAKLTDTGKVDARTFASIMDNDAVYKVVGCTNKHGGYPMIGILCGKDGIPMEDIKDDAGRIVEYGFRWRGNESKGIPATPAAKQYVEYAIAYLREAFPSMRFDSVNTSAPKRREEVPAAILASLPI
jgi:hypothetical protein